MGFHLPLIFAILSLAAVALANHAAQPAPQLYWNSVLPNTQMPRAISELLHPDSTNEEKSKPENFPLANKNYLQQGYGKGKPVQKGYGKGKPVQKGYGKGKPVQKGYGKRSPPSDNQLLHYKELAIFFFEKDMRPGTTMKFQFPRNSNTATFLSRESAQSIPFSSNKLPEIFNHFSVKPTSVEAQTIKQTIEGCEALGIKGEEKYCATSLESMVDFSTSKLGTRNVEAISTEVLESGATMSMHNYTTMPGLKKLAGDKVVVCHKENYPYAVFFCHAIKQTAAYVLSLKGDDGEKVKAVTICHLDTSEWDPEHLSFQILNVKPGTVPICHFISTDAIAWVPKHKSA
ncbi:PREDICTED: BURP domain protein RD22-like isoform X2 [Prunus mume]|uniref:BURP domain protein RD22-like isoform X2 n=1 Tax=Prunus mume TaxID=102107 RepID=A0ABM1LKA3_PRUMU|nr:PREDICTED: BURP domain protein RD22-like isoform X2 [Prunus mume]